MKVRISVTSIGGGRIVRTKVKFKGGGRAGEAGGPCGPGRAGASVTSAMQAEAVKVFLAQGDAARLGRALAAVYAAMEAVRVAGPGREDDD